MGGSPRLSNADRPAGCAPIPGSAFGPAVNEQGYYVGRVEGNLYWVTDGTYQSAFLTTSDGVVLFDAPPTHRSQHPAGRGRDRRRQRGQQPGDPSHLLPPPRRSRRRVLAVWPQASPGSGTRRRGSCCSATTTPRGLHQRRPSRTDAPSRSEASASNWPGTAPITRRTTSSSICPTTTR